MTLAEDRRPRTRTPRLSTSGGPLRGLRVIDVSTYVAGPSCGAALAALGAEVIRIDPIGGASDTRRLPLAADGVSLYWSGLNQGKQSIELNLGHARGRELLGRLLALPDADCAVLLTNASQSLGLRYEEMARYREDLIMAEIRGHPDGRPAVDYTVNCEVGLPWLTGPVGHRGPVNHVLPAWDLLTGLHTAVAILAAIQEKSRTGRGQLVTVALSEVARSTMTVLGFVADALKNGHSRERDGNFVYGAFGSDFETADGERLMIVALTARQWTRLVELTGQRSVVDALQTSVGLDFSDEAARYRYREVLAAMVRPWFAEHSAAEAGRALDEAGIPWGRYRTIEEFAQELAGLGDVAAPAAVRYSRSHVSEPWDIELGRETDELLLHLGLTPSQIVELRADGAIGPASSSAGPA